MRFIRSLIRWTLIVVLLLGVAGLGCAYWAWSQGDEFLRNKIVAELDRRLPEWSVSIGKTRIDWRGQYLYIDEVALGKRGDDQPLVVLPQVVMAVNGEQFTKHQVVDVKRIWLKQPLISVVKEPSGKWNWQNLPPLPKSEFPSPEWVIEEGRVVVQIPISDNVAPVMLECDQINAEFIPSGKRQYLISGNVHSETVGSLGFKGRYNLDTRSYQIEGAMRDIAFNEGLISQVEDVSPETRRSLAQLTDKLRSQTLVRTAETTGNGNSSATYPVTVLPIHSGNSLGGDVSANVDVDFEVTKTVGTTEPVFNVSLQFEHGNVSHELLPFDLREVSGDLQWNNQGLALRRLSAKHGSTQLNVEGGIQHVTGSGGSSWDVQITNLALDQHLERRLTPALLKLYKSLSPTGQIDVKSRIHLRPGQKPVTEGLFLEAKDCTVTHVKFPYTVRQVTGTVRQNGDKMDLEFQGLAGRQKVFMKGWAKDPGPAAEFYCDITGDDIQLDEAALAACKLEVRQLLERLGLLCRGLGRFRYYRFPGIEKRFRWTLDAEVTDGQFRYVNFPYALDHLTGRVSFDTNTGLWEFKDVKALHGDVPLACSGSFLQKTGNKPGLLDLVLATKNAPLDDSLRYALPQAIRGVWDDFSPTGRLDLETRIRWQTNAPFELSIPRGEIHNGSLRWKQFPMPLQNLEASFQYSPTGIPNQQNRSPGLPQQILIDKFRGEYEQTIMETRADSSLFVAWQNGGRHEWELQAEDIDVKDLDAGPNSLFRRVLTGSLKETVDRLNPRRPLSLSGMLNFRGAAEPHNAVTAGWQLAVDLADNTLSVGADLSRVYGRIVTTGVVDRNGHVSMKAGNYINLSSATVLGYQIANVTGPYQLEKEILTVGSPKAFIGPTQGGSPQILDKERITGDVIGTKIFLDANVDLRDRDDVPYGLRLRLNDGDLNEYANRYLSGTNNVRGVVDGWMDLAGRGESLDNMTGVGQIQIRNAELYELPVFVQIFSALSLASPDKTAFRYAMAHFNVANQQFLFDQIDLSGNSLRLAGRGTIDFDGHVNMSFGSRIPRRFSIPGVQQVLGPLFNDWVGVEVRGTTSAPIADVKAAPQFDQTMRQFLKTFDGRDPMAIPNIMPRPTFQFPMRRTGINQSRNPNIR